MIMISLSYHKVKRNRKTLSSDSKSRGISYRQTS